jgi:hypothetical protein
MKSSHPVPAAAAWTTLQRGQAQLAAPRRMVMAAVYTPKSGITCRKALRSTRWPATVAPAHQQGRVTLSDKWLALSPHTWECVLEVVLHGGWCAYCTLLSGEVCRLYCGAASSTAMQLAQDNQPCVSIDADSIRVCGSAIHYTLQQLACHCLWFVGRGWVQMLCTQIAQRWC